LTLGISFRLEFIGGVGILVDAVLNYSATNNGKSIVMPY